MGEESLRSGRSALLSNTDQTIGEADGKLSHGSGNLGFANCIGGTQPTLRHSQGEARGRYNCFLPLGFRFFNSTAFLHP